MNYNFIYYATGTMATKSKTQVAALVALIILLVVALLIGTVFLFFLIRKNRTVNYTKKINEMSTKIKNSSILTMATIARFQQVSKTKKDYLKTLNDLIKIDRELKSNYESMMPLFNNINYLLKRYKLKEVSKTFKLLNGYYKSYIKLNEEFSALSDQLNRHWNIIDTISTNSNITLKQLSEYIEVHKNDLKNSYDFLIGELKKLKVETFNFEERKTNDDLRNVSFEINEHEKRIKAFVEKVDHMVNLEYAVFTNLPEILTELLNKTSSKEEVQKLLDETKELQEKFRVQPYQQQLEKTRKIYNSYFIIVKKTNLANDLNSYLQSNLSKIKKTFIKLNKQINIIAAIIEDSEPIDKNSFESFKTQWLSVNDEFDELKEKIKNKEEIGFIDIQAFFEHFFNTIEGANDFLSDFDAHELKKKYSDYYKKMSDIWYLKVLNLRQYLEKSTENDNKFARLIFLNKKITDDFEKNKIIDMNSILWKNWNELIIELYKKTYTQYIYKKMAERIIRKVSPHRKIENVELNETLLIANKHITNLKFKEAYEILSSFLTKGNKRYVQ